MRPKTYQDRVVAIEAILMNFFEIGEEDGKELSEIILSAIGLGENQVHDKL